MSAQGNLLFEKAVGIAVAAVSRAMVSVAALTILAGSKIVETNDTAESMRIIKSVLRLNLLRTKSFMTRLPPF